jgi:hypothetical protein
MDIIMQCMVHATLHDGRLVDDMHVGRRDGSTRASEAASMSARHTPQLNA